MRDSITEAIRKSYKKMTESGLATAKKGEVRKYIKPDDSTRKQLAESQKAYFDTVLHVSYDDIVEEVNTRRQKSTEPDRRLDESVMDSYVKKLR